MQRIMLHLLVTLLLPLALLPCSCDTISLSQVIQFSDEIFTGKIIRAEERAEGGWRLIHKLFLSIGTARSTSPGPRMKFTPDAASEISKAILL
ncbi:MAG: hypothetical protein KTR30_28300 [Saprospiraceae bacterium]|nr:hypothetical protein [Saprospiraceae bacterium]